MAERRRRASLVDRERAVPVVHHEVAGDVGPADAVDPQVDVAILVDVARRGRLEMEVGRAGVVRVRAQLVLASDRVGQRVRRPEPAVRTAQEQLRRIPVATAHLAHVNARVEDGEVRVPVAVEVGRDQDRVARIDRPFDQLRRRGQTAVLPAGEHVQRRLCESVLGRSIEAVLLAPPRHDVVPAVAVEIGDGEHEIEPPETRVGGDPREADAGSGLCISQGAAEHNRRGDRRTPWEEHGASLRGLRARSPEHRLHPATQRRPAKRLMSIGPATGISRRT